MSSITKASNSGGLNYIEHQVSKMDTLAGVAIKYGVEVADIKRMNGLATDLQMFALKSLQIPLPGRHPPSSSLSNGSVSHGENSPEETPPHLGHSNVVESFQSLRLKSPQRKVSPAMSTLQNYYGLRTPNHKAAAEGMEMAVYRVERLSFSDEGVLPKASPISDPRLSHHNKYGNLADNGILLENGIVTEDVPISEAGDVDGERSNEKSVRRRQKAEADFVASTPERLRKEENGSGSSGFSAKTGKGLAQRPKSASRNSLIADIESGLNPVPVGLGDSIMTDGLSGFRKSSSASSLQDQDNNSSSSVWPTSRWNLKPDLQVLSTTAIARPIFDGLPKPIAGRWSKAARD